MNITPKVYTTTLAVKNGQSIINALNNVLTSPLGTHHWDVITHVPSTSILIQCKANANRQVNFVGITGNVTATLSFDGGATFSPDTTMGSGGLLITNANYGISTDSFFVVEVEDAIMLYSGKGSNGGTSLSTGGFGMSLAAGNLYMSIDRNGDQGFNGEGLMGGMSGIYATADPYCWFSLNTTGGGEQSQLWANAWHKLCIPTTTLMRSSSASPFPAPLMPVGDGQANDRFIPYPVVGANSGATAGLAGYTKYIRAHRNRVGSETTQNTVAASTSDANVGWRHNRGSSLVTTNTVYVWCPSGGEVAV